MYVTTDVLVHRSGSSLTTRPLSQGNICRFIQCYEDERIIYLVLEVSPSLVESRCIQASRADRLPSAFSQYVDGGNLLEYIMKSPGEGGLRRSARYACHPPLPANSVWFQFRARQLRLRRLT
jgi:hypothetical protein